LTEALGGGNGGKRDVWEGGGQGLVIAKVTNIKDPDNLNRVMCKPVSTDPEVLETDWCHCLAPYGGNGYGAFMHPNVDDLVVLAYIAGDIQRPLVIGSIWQGAVKAAYTVSDGKNETVSFKSPKGVEMKFELQDGKEKLTLTTPKAAYIKIDDEAESITISDTGGDNSIAMDLKGGKIAIKAKSEFSVTVGSASTTLKSSGDVAIKGGKVEITGSTAVNAKGTQVSVKADSQMALEATGPASLKGAIVKIN